MPYTAAKFRILGNEIETIEGRLEGRLDPRISDEEVHSRAQEACRRYLADTAATAATADKSDTNEQTIMYAICLTGQGDTEIKLVNQIQWDYLNSPYNLGSESSKNEIPPKHVRERMWQDIYESRADSKFSPQSADEITIHITNTAINDRALGIQADKSFPDNTGITLQFDSIEAVWAFCIQNNITVKDNYEGQIY
jgi:hypothetical protein